MLALGGVDNVIRIFTRPAGGMFQAACKLAGHGDWVRTLAFYAVPEHQNASHRSGKLRAASARRGASFGKQAMTCAGPAHAIPDVLLGSMLLYTHACREAPPCLLCM